MSKFDIYFVLSDGRACQTFTIDHENMTIGDLDKIEEKLAAQDPFNYAKIVNWRRHEDRDD